MNIFILADNHEDNVQALCDSHVVKMTLETAQILSAAATILRLPPFPSQYKATHANHPCVKWAAASLNNLHWLTEYGLAIAQEFSYRYNNVHSSLATIYNLYRTLPQPTELPSTYAIAIKEHLRQPKTYQPLLPLQQAIAEYRAYYIADKLSFARYNNGRLAPDWLVSPTC